MPKVAMITDSITCLTRELVERYSPQVSQPVEVQPVQEPAPTGADIPLASLVKAAKTDSFRSAPLLHSGQETSAFD